MLLSPGIVKSTPVHVQGTAFDVKEPVGHVQTEPSSVINLVSGEYEEEERQPVIGRDYIKNLVDEQYRKIKEDIRSGKQPSGVTASVSTAAESSTPQMTSAGASSSFGQHLSHEVNPHAESASRNAMHIGDVPPKTTFHPGNVVYDDVHQLPPIQETERPWVVVDRPPRLPSGTQRAIEDIVQAHMKQLGVNVRPQQANEGMWESTAGNNPNPSPENSQFSFPIFQEGAASAAPSQQVFATA